MNRKHVPATRVPKNRKPSARSKKVSLARTNVAAAKIAFKAARLELKRAKARTKEARRVLKKSKKELKKLSKKAGRNARPIAEARVVAKKKVPAKRPARKPRPGGQKPQAKKLLKIEAALSIGKPTIRKPSSVAPERPKEPVPDSNTQRPPGNLTDTNAIAVAGGLPADAKEPSGSS